MQVSRAFIAVSVCIVALQVSGLVIPIERRSPLSTSEIVQSVPIVGDTLATTLTPVTGTLDGILMSVLQALQSILGQQPAAPAATSTVRTSLPQAQSLTRRDGILEPVLAPVKNLPVVGGVVTTVLAILPLESLLDKVLALAAPPNSKLPTTPELSRRESSRIVRAPAFKPRGSSYKSSPPPIQKEDERFIQSPSITKRSPITLAPRRLRLFKGFSRMTN